MDDFITELFCMIDDEMKDVPNHSQAALHPSELATIGVLFAIKGVGCRAFYRWLSANHIDKFPKLPERTRLFRRLRTHRHWTDNFMATPSMLGVVDSYGIELIHPVREGRSPSQIGKKGKSNYRWIVGVKLCLALNNLGLVVAWGLRHRQRVRRHLPSCDREVRRPDGGVERHGVPQRQRRPFQFEGVPARRVERAYEGGDCLVDADEHMPHQEDAPQGLGLPQDPSGVSDGRLQHNGAVGWPQTPMRKAWSAFPSNNSASNLQLAPLVSSFNPFPFWKTLEDDGRV